MSFSNAEEISAEHAQKSDQLGQSPPLPDRQLFGGRQLNVCALAYTFYESDARVMRYARTLHRLGHRVDVIALRKPGGENYEILDGMNVYRIQERVVNERSQFSYLVRFLGFLFRAMAVIAQKHLSRPYDFIHVHSVPDFLVFAAWMPKLMGAKIILDIHDLLPEFYASKFNIAARSFLFRRLVAVERMSAAFADHVIVANEIFRQSVISRSVQETKCTAILNYPDQSIFRCRGKNRTDGKFIILYPGTMNHHQGVDIAVRAFAKIKDEVPEAEFHIYGKGPQKPMLSRMIQDHALQGRVFLNDLVPLREITRLMQNADLGLVPKRTDSFGNEALSTKILEFMSLGVPVLAADAKVERHYLGNSLVRFFRGGDEENLADSMLAMIRDPHLRSRLAANGQEFIRHNNWAVKESLYLEILSSLFERSSTKRVFQRGVRATRLRTKQFDRRLSGKPAEGPGGEKEAIAKSELNQAFIDHFRCPSEMAAFALAEKLSGGSGFFRFGGATCYGQSSAGTLTKRPGNALYDVLEDVTTDGSAVVLPFDPTQVVHNLQLERYRKVAGAEGRKFSDNSAVRRTYYLFRPLLSIAFRKHLQRMHLKRKSRFPDWPVDRTVGEIFEQLWVSLLQQRNRQPNRDTDRIPFIWFWPQGFHSCLIMTHDVEGKPGMGFSSQLMDIDDAFGFKSSFQLVPEQRYTVSDTFLEGIRKRGFEVNVHDLNHDGQLFTNRREFLRRSQRINHYGEKWGASGFRSGALYREPDWYEALGFSYDMSIPNSSFLDPQHGGCCTIMPYFIGDILELPVTMTQDYSLFHLLKTYTIDLWKKEIALIAGKNGLLNFIVHPDYLRRGTRELDVYQALLQHLSDLRSEGTMWAALPKEVNDWWRQRNQMQLVYQRGTWRIEGEGKERARIAYASLDDGILRFTLQEAENREQESGESG